MVTEEDIRRVALSLPGSAEKPDNRLPSFRVRGNLFLRIHELPNAFLVRCVGPDERDELLQAEPGTFFTTPHYAGYPAVLLRLSQIDPGRDDRTRDRVMAGMRSQTTARRLRRGASTRTMTGAQAIHPTEQRMSARESRHLRALQVPGSNEY
jgi:hypothetical protein